jgi:hypothetical protein
LWTAVCNTPGLGADDEQAEGHEREPYEEEDDLQVASSAPGIISARGGWQKARIRAEM